MSARAMHSASCGCSRSLMSSATSSTHCARTTPASAMLTALQHTSRFLLMHCHPAAKYWQAMQIKWRWSCGKLQTKGRDGVACLLRGVTISKEVYHTRRHGAHAARWETELWLVEHASEHLLLAGAREHKRRLVRMVHHRVGKRDTACLLYTSPSPRD